MIKYNLKCNNNHEFESWFSSSDEYDKLKNKKLLECIYCNSKTISKTIMSPMISITEKINDRKFKSLQKKLSKEKLEWINVRNYVERNFEYVGNDFSKKVREIYYDKKNKKNIYGTTTEKERLELADEGINLLSIPWPDKDN